MYSISVFQTECKDVNTVNGIHALLDTAAQMGCWTSFFHTIMRKSNHRESNAKEASDQVSVGQF